MSGAIGAAIWLLLQATSGLAAPARVDVERGAGADDCPDGRALDGLIGAISNAPEAGEVRAAVAFRHGPAGYEASLRFGGATEGQRTLTDTGPTCEALGRAVAITIALVIDATAARAPAPSADVTAAAPPLAPEPARAKTSGVLSVLGGPAVGLVGPPSVMGGVALSAGVWRRLRVEGAAQIVAPRASPLDPGTVEVGLLAARLSACVTVNDAEARWPVALCARGLGGRLRGSGRGFPAANVTRDLAFWAVGGGAEVQHTWGERLVVGAEATVLAPLRTSTFSVGNRGVAYESAAVAAMLQLAVGVAIW
ncbi:MAG TPA: hypothetical protein VHK47_19380 [Polyangia bacterium]|nr:hypothetical protein [Polyangia bacterium]